MKRTYAWLIAGMLVAGFVASATLRAEKTAETKPGEAKSDWCGYCIKLNKAVFSKPEFAKWADKFVLVELDFPHSKAQSDAVKKQNAELNKKYSIEGFPTILILDSNEKTLSTTVGYGGDSAKDWMAARDKEIAAAQK